METLSSSLCRCHLRCYPRFVDLISTYSFKRTTLGHQNLLIVSQVGPQLIEPTGLCCILNLALEVSHFLTTHAEIIFLLHKNRLWCWFDDGEFEARFNEGCIMVRNPWNNINDVNQAYSVREEQIKDVCSFCM